jgi:hypothetical protein
MQKLFKRLFLKICNHFILKGINEFLGAAEAAANVNKTEATLCPFI